MPDMAKDMAMATTCQTGTLCTTTTIMDQTIDLNTNDPNGPVMFNILANKGYSGMVNITVMRSAIDALAGGPEPDVHIQAVPSTAQVTGGTPTMVTVHLGATTAAAAFTAQPVTLHVADTADSSKSFDVKFNLTVTNKLTITFAGDGLNVAHTWDTDNVSTSVMVGGAPHLNFNVRSRTAQQGGTTLIFLNKDTSAHIVHGDPPIVHQDTAGTGTPPNGTYAVPNVVFPTTTMANVAGFYCHNHSQPTRYVTAIP
jgi:hypothetical protein